MLAIFTFGGDSIRGFMFALIIGVVVGTYSSLFVATPVMYDTSKRKEASKLILSLKTVRIMLDFG
jgi:SecD/SecF fusion protein